MAGVFVLDIADAIRSRLGDPTVAVLARRFGTDGHCLTCGERLGTAPLSVRAYRSLDQIITLIAHHATCAASAWCEPAPDDLPGEVTWAAAATKVTVPVRLHRFRLLHRPAAQHHEMPMVLVHPSLERVRIRRVGPGETVNHDFEGFSRIGFGDPDAFARAWPRMTSGCAWIQAADSGTWLFAQTVATSGPWFARACAPVADLAVARGGVLLGITCDRDPHWLARESRYLEDAVGNGEILLAWAPFSGAQAPDPPLPA